MHAMMRGLIRALGVAAVITAWTATAGAQCSYTTLLSGAAATATGGVSTNTDYQFTQTNVFWTAVGVRPDPGSDWDIGIYQGTAAFPTCVATLLGNSARVSGVDFVVGDFNHNPTGTYYAAATHFSGAGNGKVQWDSGADLLTVNAPVVQQATDATNVLQIWDVYLVQDSTYSFEFSHTGAADTHLLLFRNVAGGTLWEGRNAAEFDVTNSTGYKAPSTGYYGVVVVNDNGGTGSFSVQVGECLPPVAIGFQQPVVTTGAENWYDSFEEGPPFGHFWAGVAVRPTGGSSDWDLEIYSDPNGNYPVCLSSPVGSSNLSPPRVDLVLGDFDYNPSGTYYARAHLYQDIGSGSATVQLQDDRYPIVSNDFAANGTTGPNDVFRLLTAPLEAGKTYQFLFSETGTANLRLLLFQNPAAGTYWTGRSGAMFEAAPGTITFTAPATDNYAVVVVNDDGGTATWQLALGTCDPPSALSSYQIVSTLNAVDHWSIDQEVPYWTVVANTSNYDFDISAYSTQVGSNYPACASGLLANSQYGPGITDLVVGDFNHNPPGTYYIDGYAYQFAGEGEYAEWDSGADVVAVNGPTIVRPIPYENVDQLAEVWDVLLVAGHTYTFTMNQEGNSQRHLLLFRNPSGGTYWAGRSAAAFDLTSGVYVYTAPTSGFYGIVVVSDNHVDDYFYYFRVDEGILSADATPPAVTGLTAVGPNPMRGAATIDFSLARPGDVALDVLDTGGRRVAALGGRFAEGRHAMPWDGRNLAGARLPAGLYFVRMRAEGHDIATRRITLLE